MGILNIIFNSTEIETFEVVKVQWAHLSVYPYLNSDNMAGLFVINETTYQNRNQNISCYSYDSLDFMLGQVI